MVGKTYHCFDYTWTAGIPGTRLLNADEKDMLDAEARNVVKTTDGERHDRPAFQFRLVADDDTAASEGAGAKGDRAAKAGGGEGAGAAGNSAAQNGSRGRGAQAST